jgi:uncharacterized protein YggU (UPF0235/DUF167 family)
LSSGLTPPWKAEAGGLLLTVRATPKGGRDGIDGADCLADGSAVLKVRVQAAPEDGDANAAVIRVIAKAACVAPSTVSIVRGTSSRIKAFRLSGDPKTLAAAFERALAGVETKKRARNDG